MRWIQGFHHLEGICGFVYAVATEANCLNAIDQTPQPIRKRKIALLRSMNRPQRAIEELVALLDIFAVDGESWAELAEVYVEQGAYAQAVYCLEEVLLIAPNAWNVRCEP